MPDISTIKKVLIIRPGAIGDVILTTAFIRALKKANPIVQIDYMAAPLPARALCGNPNINRVIIFDKNELKKGGAFATIIKTLSYYMSLRKYGYDMVFDLFGNFRTALMSVFTGAKYRVGFTFRVRKYLYNIRVKPDPQPKYNVWYHMDLLKAVNIKDDGQRTEFYVKKQSEDKAEAFMADIKKPGKNVIGLNPSGTWITKRWPPARFGQLAALIAGQHPGTEFVVLWGPGELEMAREVLRASGLKDTIRLAPETDLNEMAAVIKKLDLMVTNDGAPKHMASALGIPTVTVFGPTNSLSWNEKDDPLHAAVVSAENCAPCDRTDCPDLGIKCMNNIKAETVFETVERVLGTQNR